MTMDPQKYTEKIVDNIASRQPVIYTIKDAICRKICCCCRTSKKEKLKRERYEQCCTQLEEELDIRYISQQLRTLKLIANVLLTKFQRDLIPHFKDNLVKLGDSRKQNTSYA
jgi:hypothetical protein